VNETEARMREELALVEARLNEELAQQARSLPLMKPP